MNSLWGLIAHIIEKTGWTWDYTINGISWINIRMMLADAPQYQSKSKHAVTDATDDDLDDLMIE